jgi:hypothetical protein
VSDTVSATLASILRSGRSELNTRFAEARVRHGDLDAEAFGDFVRTAIDPLVIAVERVRPDAVTNVARAAYDVGLELVGQKLAGRSARAPHVADTWHRVLPTVPSLVASDPERVISAVCNAAHNLSTTAGARPTQWIDTMAQLGHECADVATFLRLGQVAAWRAGMAHFRAGALAEADKLPEPLALAAIGAPTARWSRVRDRLAAVPWFDPSAPNDQPIMPRVTARAGAFRGFGGLFTAPPTVAMADNRLFVRDGNECWLLEADLFGATFNRTTIEEFDRAASRPAFTDGVSLRGTTLTVRGTKVDLSDAVDEVSSACANRTTLALTSPFTHAITLVALPSA